MTSCWRKGGYITICGTRALDNREEVIEAAMEGSRGMLIFFINFIIP